jgi:hypothetical protein
MVKARLYFAGRDEWGRAEFRYTATDTDAYTRTRDAYGQRTGASPLRAGGFNARMHARFDVLSGQIVDVDFHFVRYGGPHGPGWAVTIDEVTEIDGSVGT